MRTGNQIRDEFCDFFKKRGHTFVPSSPVVPIDDPTLLFTNAGMNQFKDVILGTGSRPYKRAVNSQKCIRAGGKHNDLDDVGKDTYHHTNFEMLGNWSFGEYFKKEAIAWAWELLTDVWGVDKARLHATVFGGDSADGLARDEESAHLWRSVTDIDPTHIHFGGKKDNFWEMADTGPCGPCSEIHIDRTPDKSGGRLVNAGQPEVMEIWNLVFMQNNRSEDRKLTLLPAKNVDTGMGFERITAILQGKNSNYDTDIFTPILAAIHDVTGATAYTRRLDDLRDVAYRVVADHIRALTFAVTDGARPGNEGRDYVLRRILRRAERYGRQYLGTRRPFLCELVTAVVDVMGHGFPELSRASQLVAGVIRDEEESFIRTLDRGIVVFQEAAERAVQVGHKTISGDDAFQLHDTYGLYIDITEQMAGEAGLAVDLRRYAELMEEAKRQARAARKKLVITTVMGELPKTDDRPKYQGLRSTGTVIGWVADSIVVRSGSLELGDEAALLFDRTNFYAEQGGQVGDIGEVATPTGRFAVADTQKHGDSILHIGRVVSGRIDAGQFAALDVSAARADTMRNHTATHLLRYGLNSTLGVPADQRGSRIQPEKLTWDFTHSQPLTEAQIEDVERLVNAAVTADHSVISREMPIEEARRLPGVQAPFGEKYGDVVRVVEIGDGFSREFCGGTHLSRSGQVGFFKIVDEEAVGKGVRRVTCVTGRYAVAEAQKLTRSHRELANLLHCGTDEVSSRVVALFAEVKRLNEQLKDGSAQQLEKAADRLLAGAVPVNGSKVIVGELPAAPGGQIRQQIDRVRRQAGSAVVVVGWIDGGKVEVIASVTDDLVPKGLRADELLNKATDLLGGGGGGRSTFAKAGGKRPDQLHAAFELIRHAITEKLGTGTL